MHFYWQLKPCINILFGNKKNIRCYLCLNTESVYLKYLKCLLKCVHSYHFDFQMQDPYPPISKNRQTSAPAATRAGSRPSSKYGSQPGSTKEDRGGLSVTSSRLVSSNSGRGVVLRGMTINKNIVHLYSVNVGFCFISYSNSWQKLSFSVLCLNSTCDQQSRKQTDMFYMRYLNPMIFPSIFL